MPPSALDQLTRLNIVYPMLFKLSNKKTDRTTHCGVLEFIADEGKILSNISNIVIVGSLYGSLSIKVRSTSLTG